MALISGKSGHCSNFGNCSLADARTVVEVPNGMDFVCTECGKPLLMTETVAKTGNSRALTLGLLLLVLLLAAGGIAWSLARGKKSPDLPAAVPPAVVQEAPTQPVPAQLPSPPLTGHCSAADERAGVCRVAR